MGTLTHDWVHEKYFSTVYVWGKFGVEYFGFMCFLVTLYEDFPNANGSAAVSKTLFHCLTWWAQAYMKQIRQDLWVKV